MRDASRVEEALKDSVWTEPLVPLGNQLLQAECLLASAPGVPTCDKHQSKPFADTDSVLRTLGVAQGHTDVVLVVWSCFQDHWASACPLFPPSL